MIDTGQLITTRFTSQGTHKGELRGIAPTNKPIRVEGMVIHRISRGHIVEGWVMWDALGLMQQLGVVPALEKAKPKPANKQAANFSGKFKKGGAPAFPSKLEDPRHRSSAA
jgi:hypothetical protein